MFFREAKTDLNCSNQSVRIASINMLGPSGVEGLENRKKFRRRFFLQSRAEFGVWRHRREGEAVDDGLNVKAGATADDW